MLKNYLTIAVRNLLRQKFYSLINILGLSVGLACCLLILCYVNYESQYDQHHQNVDRLYRILLKKRGTGGEYFYFTHTAGKLTSTLQAEYPEIEYGLRTFVRPMFVT
ncbi:MAG: ABC transporter permease, partial [Candidatus Latescibacteria bacterium]|nr:ABC transporter permease [Candidatus Latescibacterota bacterium]